MAAGMAYTWATLPVNQFQKLELTHSAISTSNG